MAQVYIFQLTVTEYSQMHALEGNLCFSNFIAEEQTYLLEAWYIEKLNKIDINTVKNKYI